MNGNEELRAEWLSKVEQGLWNKSFWKKLTPVQLQKFIDADAEINAQDRWGFSAIHRIAENNENPDVTKKLIDAGADIYSATALGSPPLHWAAQNNQNPAVIKEFLTRDPNIINDKGVGNRGKGNSPLHWAAESNKNVAVIKELINAGANIHGKNANGETAHDLLSKNSALKDNTEAQELLLRGKITNKTSRDDNDEHATPLRNDEYKMPHRNGLDDEQEYAKKVIEDWIKKPTPQIARLWGYAGTGKTTFIQSLNFGKIKPHYCAFTGKAASVMRKKGMENATTIHGLIYNLDYKTTNEEHGDEDLTFKLRPRKNYLGLVIVDECSMVNKEIGQDLLRVTEKLLVLGDQGQLPPVEGTGFFNRSDLDAIDLEFTTIHRQATDSPILDFATRARLGQKIEPSNDPACTVKIEPTPSNINSLHEKGDIIICWRNRTRHEFNQDALKMRNLTKGRLMEGMQVVCVKNNHDLGLLNGTIWTVKEVGNVAQHTDGKIQENYATAECILMDDEGKKRKAHLINSSFGKSKFDFSHLKNKNHAAFDYGYAITCHKAQGSQWERVSICVEIPRSSDDYDKWLYTAATRAEKSLYVLFATTPN